MIRTGIIAMIVGLISVVYGIIENSNIERHLMNLLEKGETNPGNPFIAVGAIVIITGVVLFVAGLVQKNKYIVDMP